MATLTSTKIKNTYDALLKASDNDAIGSSAKQITDGLGNGTPLYISTTQIGIGVTPEATYDLHVYSNAKVGGNLTVTGDLTVEGTTTTIDTQTLTVEDPLIEVASNNTSTDAVDIGWYGKYAPSGTVLYAGLFRDTGDSKFKLFKSLQEAPTTTVNTSGTGYTVATLVADVEGTLTGIIASSTTATTQSLADNSTKVATTAYVDSSIGNSTLAEVLANGNTTGGGNIVFGDSDVFLTDDTLMFGASNDLVIYHNGSHSFIREKGTGNLYIDSDVSINLRSYTGAENMLVATKDGSVDLYYDDNKKLETTTTGVTVTGAVSATTFSGQLDGTISSTTTATTQTAGDNSTKVATTAYVDGATGGGTLATTLSNGNTTGGTDIVVSADDDIVLDSDSKLLLGDGSSATYGAYIAGGANGNSIYAYVDSHGAANGGFNIYEVYGNAGESDLLFTTTNGAVKLYNSNSVKLETTSTGLSVTGKISDLTDPTAAQDAATKAYVDSQVGSADTLAEVLANGNTSGSNDIIMSDDQKINFGTGSDLQIYHNGTNSFIQNTTGDFSIENAADDGNITFVSDDGSGGTATYIRIDGGTEETLFLRKIRLNDNVEAHFGTGRDLQIYHDGSNSYINETGAGSLLVQASDLFLRAGGTNNTNNALVAYNAGNVVLYHASSAKLETTSAGIAVTGRISNLTDPSAAQDAATKAYVDSQVGANNELSEVLANGNTTGGTDISVNGDNIIFGDSSAIGTDDTLIFGAGNDLRIAHNGTDSIIRNYTGGLYIDQEVDDGDIYFRADNGSGAKAEYFRLDGSLVNGSTTLGATVFPDKSKIFLGDSYDLRIYHDTSNSYIQDAGTGDLIIQASNNLFLQSYTNSKNILKGVTDAQVELYYNNSKKLETTSTGVTVGEGTGNRNIKILAGSSNPAAIYFGDTADDDIGSIRYDNSTDALKFFTNTAFALTIDSSQNVGIGTDSPDLNLHLYANDTSGKQFMIDQDSTGDAVMSFRLTGVSEYTMGIDNSDSDKFKIANSGTVGTTTRMTIDSSGNVGIGTTSPSGNLHVVGASGSAGRIYISDVDNGTDGLDSILAMKSGTHAYYYNRDDGDLYLGTNNAQQLAIKPSGNVGIGTTSPDLKLHVDGGDLKVRDTGNVAIQIISSNSLNSAIQFGDDGDTNDGRIVYENTGDNMLFYTNDSERMRIDSSGNVMVNTTNPLVADSSTDTGLVLGGQRNLLHVSRSGADAARFNRIGSDGRVLSLSNDGTDVGGFGVAGSDLTFETGSSERMRITSTGAVGIGTTSPDAPLEIQDIPAQASQKMMLHLDANHTGNQGSAYMQISAGSNSQAATRIEQVSSGGSGLFGTYLDTNIINQGQSASAHGNINFVTNQAIRMTIGAGPNAGNVGIGTTSPSYKLHVNGNVFGESFGNGTSTYSRIFAPAGAKYNGGQTVTGALTFILPQTGVNCMLTVKIRVFDYAEDAQFDVHASGYYYTGNNWTRISAWIDSVAHKDRNFTVRFGKRNSDGKGTIHIGETNSSWSYVKFGIVEVVATHSNGHVEKWNEGWSTTVLTDYTGYTVLRSQPNCQVNNWQRDGQNAYYGGTGNVGIGETSPASDLVVRSDSSGGRGGEISIVNYASNAVGNEAALNFGLESSTYDADNGNAQIKAIVTNGSNAASQMRFSLWNGGSFNEEFRMDNNGDFHADGDVVAYSTTISDARLKDNVKPLESSLDKIMNLKGVEYTWNNGSRKGQKDIGFIAQEVEDVIPEIVREKKVIFDDDTEYKTVDYEKITAVLVEAVKELKQEIVELKKQIK